MVSLYGGRLKSPSVECVLTLIIGCDAKRGKKNPNHPKWSSQWQINNSIGSSAILFRITSWRFLDNRVTSCGGVDDECCLWDARAGVVWQGCSTTSPLEATSLFLLFTPPHTHTHTPSSQHCYEEDWQSPGISTSFSQTCPHLGSCHREQIVHSSLSSDFVPNCTTSEHRFVSLCVCWTHSERRRQG